MREEVRVTAVSVVYGNRWVFFKQVADAVLGDEKVTTFVVVNNGCSDSDKLTAYATNFGKRVVILDQGKNIGYSGAIAKGLEYARITDCDYVFILDDDSVPEEGAIDIFLSNLELFPTKQVVLTGNRINVPGNKDVFSRKMPTAIEPKGTLFEVFAFRKLLAWIRLALRISVPASKPFVPIVPMGSFVTGGTFLPIEAVREAPLPDASLFIYGEDLEYSWRIVRLGYKVYQCSRPYINDIDMTFPREGDHIFSLFRLDFPAYKVYYRTRNAVIISRRNTTQSKFVLFLNVCIRTFALLIFGICISRSVRTYLSRVRIILRGVYDGYQKDPPLPKYIQTPN